MVLECFEFLSVEYKLRRFNANKFSLYFTKWINLTSKTGRWFSLRCLLYWISLNSQLVYFLISSNNFAYQKIKWISNVNNVNFLLLAFYGIQSKGLHSIPMFPTKGLRDWVKINYWWEQHFFFYFMQGFLLGRAYREIINVLLNS